MTSAPLDPVNLDARASLEPVPYLQKKPGCRIHPGSSK
jgi:hypothetical protein